MANVRLMRTEANLARVAELIDAREGTPEEEELEVLVTLVEVYEDKHYRCKNGGRWWYTAVSHSCKTRS